MSTSVAQWINSVKVIRGVNQSASPIGIKTQTHAYCTLAGTLGIVSRVALGAVECGAGV